MLAQRPEHCGEHQLAIHPRIFLCPVDGLDVFVEQLRALAHKGEVAVGEPDLVALHLAPRKVDEMSSDAIAGAAAAAVQHHPDAIILIEADFDEVIAAAERSQLLVWVLVLDRCVALDDPRVSIRQRAPGARDAHGRVLPGADPPFAAAVRNRRLDLAAQRVQIVR